MDINNSILQDIRTLVGLDANSSDFDTDLLIPINGAISKLNQNGVGRFLVIIDDEPTWGDLQDPAQTEGNKYFSMVPVFIGISTKLLFDPPPPSSVQYHTNMIEEMLWRLKVAYEEPIDVEEVTTNE